MPRIIDHDQRRRDIVEVAKKLIIEGGFEAATMRSIVTAAGFANGALKRYFASKDAIVAATFESVLAETGERMQSLDPELAPMAALRAFVRAGLPLEDHEIASARVLIALWNHSLTNRELARRYAELLGGWRADLALRVAAARGREEAADAPAIAALADEIISVTVGAHVTSLMFPPGHLVPHYTRYLDHLMLRIDA